MSDTPGDRGRLARPSSGHDTYGALCVWWGEIYTPRAEEVPDPDDDSLPLDVSPDPKGRIAVMWHGELQNAVKRWRANSKCTPSECVLDRQNGDLVAEWRRRRGRTMTYMNRVNEGRRHEGIWSTAGMRPSPSAAALRF